MFIADNFFKYCFLFSNVYLLQIIFIWDILSKLYFCKIKVMLKLIF